MATHHRLDLPHHDGSPLHVSDADVQPGSTVSVFVRVPRTAGVTTVHVRTTPDAEPLHVAAVIDRGDEREVWWRAEIALRNPLTNYRFLLDGPGGYRWLTAAGVLDWEPTDAGDFRISMHRAPPAWAADAVCYQVFPDRFARSVATRPLPDWAIPAAWDDPVMRGGDAAMRQLYGGDLQGIIDRLDHITALGADTLYLTPVFPAASNHRYDASSFEHVDALLGGDAALAALTGALHARGMRLLGDLSVNHSGDTHAWFRQAQADPGAPEAAYYRFRSHPHEYETWLDVLTLPKFNHRNADLRARLYEGPESVAARWLRAPFRLDGWRVDAANMAGRSGLVDENAAIARALRRTMAGERPDALLIAEHCHDASRELDGDGWHGTMNYAGFTRPVWTWLGCGDPEVDFLGVPVPLPRLLGHSVARTMDAFRSAVAWRTTLNNLNQLASHDTARFMTVAGTEDAAQVGATWLFTWPGIPMVFAGEELGLPGRDNEEARCPMPWDRAETWNHGMLDAYRRLVALRRRHAALRRGGFRWVAVGDDVLAYLRELPGERVLVQLSRTSHEPVTVPAGALGAQGGAHLLGGPDLRSRGGVVTLPGHGPASHVWLLEDRL